MQENKNKWKYLDEALELALPPAIHSKLLDVKNEDFQYAADEIVELAEEILNHITGLGIIYYLKSKQQKEVYNDFLIQLFNSSGHDYNAGPLYRWAANMIKELDTEMPSAHYKFFWQDAQLNSEVHHLALLRNKVMHGFFVLPPEINFAEAENISRLLIRLSEASWFEPKGNFHFYGEKGFTGKWNITDENEWQAYVLDNAFGTLCQRILNENSEAFWTAEESVFNTIKTEVPADLSDFVQSNVKGAFAVWVHPHDKQQFDLYTSIGTWLKGQENTIAIGYQLQGQGLSYTAGFLLNRLVQVLNTSGNAAAKNSKLEDVLKKLRAENKDKKVVVLVNNVHLALFSSQHLTTLNNFFYENNIQLIGIGQHYEHFDKVFNKSINVSPMSAVPTAEEAKADLHNYLRFKGPSKERSEERSDVEALGNILAHVLEELNSGKELFARRFADDKHYDLEYVLEIFSLLHPWVKTKREAFEADTVDELYGFPSTITEVTPIYLSLGRRDLKLEYQHKVISL
jgi:hypothetical protein